MRSIGFRANKKENGNENENAGFDILTIIKKYKNKAFSVYMCDGRKEHLLKSKRISSDSSAQTVQIPSVGIVPQQLFFLMRGGELVDIALTPRIKYPGFISSYLVNDGTAIPCRIETTNEFMTQDGKAPHLNIVRVEQSKHHNKLIAFERDVLDVGDDNLLVTSNSYLGAKELIIKYNDVARGKAVVISGGRLDIVPTKVLKTFVTRKADKAEALNMVNDYIRYQQGLTKLNK